MKPIPRTVLKIGGSPASSSIFRRKRPAYTSMMFEY